MMTFIFKKNFFDDEKYKLSYSNSDIYFEKRIIRITYKKNLRVEKFMIFIKGLSSKNSSLVVRKKPEEINFLTLTLI